MLPYVDSYRPDFDQSNRLQIANRVKSACIAVPQLVAGVADVALGVLCTVPAILKKVVGVYDDEGFIESSFDNGIDALKKTLPRVFESAILVLNPHGFENNTNKIKHAFFRSKEPLRGYAKDLTQNGRMVGSCYQSNSNGDKQVFSRLVALASIVTVTAAIVLDKLSAPLLVAASLLTLGRVNALNEYARRSLNLHTLLTLPFQPIFVVFPTLIVTK